MGLGKRGLSKTWISVIVIIVVLIVVVLILNLTKEEVIPPNPITVQCQNQCDAESKIGFCDVERRVTEIIVTTCYELSTNPSYTQYGIQACPTVSCATQSGTQTMDQTCVSGLGGTWEIPTANGGCEQSGTKIRRELNSSDNPPVNGQICCR